MTEEIFGTIAILKQTEISEAPYIFLISTSCDMFREGHTWNKEFSVWQMIWHRTETFSQCDATSEQLASLFVLTPTQPQTSKADSPY